MRLAHRSSLTIFDLCAQNLFELTHWRSSNTVAFVFYITLGRSALSMVLDEILVRVGHIELCEHTNPSEVYGKLLLTSPRRLQGGRSCPLVLCLPLLYIHVF